MDRTSLSIAAATAVALAVLVLPDARPLLPRYTPAKELLLVASTMVYSSRDLQMYGCWSIAQRVQAERPSRFTIWHFGGLDMIINAMKSHPQDRELLQACAFALSSMTVFAHPIVMAAGRLGAVEEVVDIMRRFEEDPDMQLASAAGSLMTYSPENRIRWAMAGGMDVTMTAIRRHYNNSKVQFEAWCSLAAGTPEPNEDRFHELGGIELAARVIRDHSENQEVVAEVLQALPIIAQHSNVLRSALLEAGVPKLIVGAMRKAPKLVRMQMSGCAILNNLAEGNLTHQEVLLRTGALEVIIETLRAFPDVARLAGKTDLPFTVYGECMKALEALAEVEEVRSVLEKNLTKEEIILAMQSEPDDWKVQTAGSTLLRLVATPLGTWD